MADKDKTALTYTATTNSVSTTWHYSFFILIAIAIPNAPFSAVASYFDLFRPLVNLDYIVAALMVAAGQRVLGVALLVALLTVDLLSIIPQIFPAITQLSDLLDLTPFILMAPRPYIIAAALTALFFATLTTTLFFVGHRSNTKSALVVFNVALYFYLSNLILTPFFSPGVNIKVHDEKFVSSQLVNYINSYISLALRDQEPPIQSTVEYTGANASWYRLVGSETPERLLLIVNESWGTNTDPRINEALIKPILNQNHKLNNLQYGAVDWSGSTVMAELKELCSFRLRKADLVFIRSGSENCLPRRLGQAGYVTHAIHGASSKMYKRDIWYPYVGLSTYTFFESKQWPAQCKSFPGACDLDMKNEITDFFTPPGKRFMYWLTLNTHAIYNLDDLRIDAFDCLGIGIENNTSTCRYLKLQAQFFHGLAEIIDDPHMAGVAVRIIGDHPPPIANKSESLKYFKENSVSWLEFTVPHIKPKQLPVIQAENRQATKEGIQR
jgi:phosphoglycerol transferase MdoB-like AlkP superfamily enzyme